MANLTTRRLALRPRRRLASRQRYLDPNQLPDDSDLALILADFASATASRRPKGRRIDQ